MMVGADRVRELLDYDTATGVFVWREHRNGFIKKGSIAGALQRNGAVHICIDKKVYLAHRLAWLWVHGVWPSRLIDHWNGVRSDNSLSNLREASASQNGANRKRNVNNTSGYRGVSWNKKSQSWVAAIWVAGRPRHLGRFETAEVAYAAYRAAAAEEYGEFYSERG